MLVAMTYSIELFLCVVFGLCVGHFTFNTKSVVGESIDPCCASQNDNQHQLLNGPSNHHGGHGSTRLTRTPCDLEGQVDSDEELIDQQHLTLISCLRKKRFISYIDKMMICKKTNSKGQIFTYLEYEGLFKG